MLMNVFKSPQDGSVMSSSDNPKVPGPLFWVIVLAGLGITLWFLIQLLSSDQFNVGARFNLEVNRTEQLLTQRFDHIVKIPFEARRLVRAAPNMDPTVWKNFADEFFAVPENQSVQELAYLELSLGPMVAPTPLFRTRAPGSQTDVSKFSWNIPAARAALEESRETGVPRVSSAFPGPLGTGKFIVIVVPLYRYAAMPVSVKDRLRELKGWVGVQVRVERVLDDLYQKKLFDTDIEIYEQSPPTKENLLLDRSGRARAVHPDTEQAVRAQRSLKIGGRVWNVWYFGKTDILQEISRRKDLMVVLATGVFGGLFLYGAVLFLLYGKKRQEAPSLEKDKKIHQMLGAAPVLLFSMDPTGRFISVEGKGSSSPKFKPQKLKGKTAAELFAGKPAVMEPLQRALKGEAFSTTLQWDDETFDTHFLPYWNSEGKLGGVQGLAANVTERDGAERRLRELLRRVEKDRENQHKGDRLKDEFLAMVTHEFRTPLTSIVGYLKLLRGSSGALNQEQEELASASLRNSERLVTLVNNLLDLIKIDSGKAQVQGVRMAVDAILDEAWSELRSKADEKNQRFECKRPDETLQITADRAMLLRVLVNLLDNAVKFTPEGGQIELGARKSALDEKPVVEFWVRDTGPGIPATSFEHLFEKFYRASASETRNDGGAGLGLTLSKKLLEMHGGRIWVDTSAKTGSIFRFVLPMDPSPPTT